MGSEFEIRFRRRERVFVVFVRNWNGYPGCECDLTTIVTCVLCTRATYLAFTLPSCLTVLARIHKFRWARVRACSRTLAAHIKIENFSEIAANTEVELLYIWIVWIFFSFFRPQYAPFHVYSNSPPFISCECRLSAWWQTACAHHASNFVYTINSTFYNNIFLHGKIVCFRCGAHSAPAMGSCWYVGFCKWMRTQAAHLKNNLRSHFRVENICHHVEFIFDCSGFQVNGVCLPATQLGQTQARSRFFHQQENTF